MSAPTITQLGKYQLIGVLGTGGMGTVYLGRSPGGRSVAVKAVHASLAVSPDFRTRFRQEVALARRVGGPFTAALLDADPEGSPPWLATEYINGRSLAQVLADHGALPPQTIRALAAGLAEALEVIHAAGVIHRDLKPSNVLLSENGPRVIDFGIAKAVEGIDLTGDGPLLGTPGYMSPEHLAGRALAPSSDVFSLGTVLAHAATGVAPFGAGQSFAVAHRVSTGPPDLSRVPAELVDLILPLLAKDPTARPPVSWILTQVGGFEAASGGAPAWLPPDVGHAIRTRKAPTMPYPVTDDGQLPPKAPEPVQEQPNFDVAGLSMLGFLAERFARREGEAPIVPASRRRPAPRPAPKVEPKPPAPANVPRPTAPPAGPRPQWIGGGNPPNRPPHPGPPQGYPPQGARPQGPPPPGPHRGQPPYGPPGARAQQAAPPREIPWHRFQFPPLRTPRGERRWTRLLGLLTVVGLTDAIAQNDATRSMLGQADPGRPAWLGSAFDASDAIRQQTGWLPDPVTSWILGTQDAGDLVARLTMVPLALLVCVILVRRGPRTGWTRAIGIAAGWVGTAICALLVLRYVHNGFLSLLWALSTLRWASAVIVPFTLILVYLLTRRRR